MIFDEVMRRTKERIEKGKRTDSLRDTDETEIKPKVIDVPAPAAEISAATTVAEIPAEPVTAPAPEKTVTPGRDESDFCDIADESIDAGDVLDAVEIAAMSIHDKAKTADEYETDTVKLAMSSADDEPPFDVDEPQKPELVLKPADENGLDISQIFTGGRRGSHQQGIRSSFKGKPYHKARSRSSERNASDRRKADEAERARV